MAAEDGEKRSAIEDLSEGFETLRNFRASLTWWMVHIIPVVAVIYGAVAWKPYYLLLGLAAIALIVVLHVRTRQFAKGLHESKATDVPEDETNRPFPQSRNSEVI